MTIVLALKFVACKRLNSPSADKDQRKVRLSRLGVVSRAFGFAGGALLSGIASRPLAAVSVRVVLRRGRKRVSLTHDGVALTLRP